MKIIGFLLLSISLVATEIEVGEISFDGNKMLLSGDFKWDHALGNISAKSAEACFDDRENPWLPYEISLQEGVSITMKDGGELIAPYAWLGCRQWIGIFHGYEGKKISYEKKADALSLKSLRMELNFVPPSAGRLVLLEKLVAEGLVEIGLSDDVHLTADLAVFDEFSPKGAFGKAALESNQSSSCVMTQELPGDLLNKIECAHAEFDLRGNKGVFFEPEGVLQRDGVPLHFKASEMVFDKESEEIILMPPVRIDWLGRLESSGKVEIARKNKKLNKVFVQGPAKLLWKDPVERNEHRLNVPGTLIIEPDKHLIEISSVNNEQLFFSDVFGDIYSDRMQLSFQELDGKLEPLQIQFEGNVLLQNKKPGTVQYALADVAQFEFGKKTLALQSKERPRVLFYDELNKVEASAESLVINRDAKTGQNVMRGIGNVRFVFAEEELNELKKRFSLETRK